MVRHVLQCLALTAALGCAQTGYKKEKPMNPQPPKTFAELSRMARDYTMGAVPEQFRQSLPIPVTGPSGVEVEFFFAPALARPKQPVELYPPGFAITLRPDGSLVMLWKCAPRDFGLNNDPSQSMGQFGLPDGWTYEDYTRRHTQLMETLNILFPQFAAKNLHPDATAARHFLQLFRELAEPPFLPYYEAVGRDFFPWVRSIAH